MNMTYARDDFMNKEMLARTKTGIQSMRQLRLVPQQQRNELFYKIEEETN
jgi:hypothetical protein